MSSFLVSTFSPSSLPATSPGIRLLPQLGAARAGRRVRLALLAGVGLSFRHASSVLRTAGCRHPEISAVQGERVCLRVMALMPGMECRAWLIGVVSLRRVGAIANQTMPTGHSRCMRVFRLLLVIRREVGKLLIGSLLSEGKRA